MSGRVAVITGGAAARALPWLAPSREKARASCSPTSKKRHAKVAAEIGGDV
jgi:hypothetical protein